MQLTLEAFVVFLTASLAAGSATAAFNYFVEREWTAFVFLALAASVSIWYGFVLLVVVHSAFAA
jgi:hypothetical protein